MSTHRLIDNPSRLLVIAVAALMVTSMIAVGGAVAQDDGPPEPPHRVFGDVVDEDDTPIEGATVEIEFDDEVVASDSTDSDGYYDVKVDGLDSGDEMTITVVEEGDIENADEKTLAYESAGSDRVDLTVEFDDEDQTPGPGPAPSPPSDDDPDYPEPEAVITIDPDPATVGDEVTFDGTGSVAEEYDIVSYEWKIDGQTLYGETVTETFDAPGTYDVELTVSNAVGEDDTATATVTVEEKPDDEDPADEDPADEDPADEDPADEKEPDDDDDGIPGFGATVAVVALLAVALLALRRRD